MAIKIKRKIKRIMIILLSIIAILAITIVIFLNQKSFGRIAGGKQAERIKKSANYRDGKFQNLSNTPQLTSDKGYTGVMLEYLFGKKDNVTPQNEIPSVKTDLLHLNSGKDVLVWFGHSSYFMQIGGKRMLVDPVFSEYASPVPFINKTFKGTNGYKAEDMPDIDYLFISHDHMDHLDYETVIKLKNKVGKIFCGLGVKEHFLHWGFDDNKIVELDWNEDVTIADGFTVHCLPARHFSGRSFSPDQSLWVSFLLQTPGFNIYIGGDSGYDTHFTKIGERFGEIDLAILENGQYNQNWKYIHMMPEEVVIAAKDLHAKALLPVHSAKLALAQHSWDEPLKKVTEASKGGNFRLITPMIGEVVNLKDTTQTFKEWWKG